jgi:hypothetical protein
MSWQLGSPNTGAAMAALDPNSVRILWQKEVDLFEQSEDFWMQFEGSSKKSPIRVINDTSVGKGLKFRVTTRAGYYGPGKTGDALFNNTTDFEPDVISSFEMDADYLRDATSTTQRTDEYMGMQMELANGQAAELGKWMGREKSARMFMTFRLLGGAQNLLFPAGITSEANLKSANTLIYNDVLLMEQALKPMGGVPCEMGSVRGSPIYKYCLVGTTPGLFGLKLDPDYKLSLQNAMPREKWDENPLWQGGYAEISGHSIREFNPIDADGYAWIGSGFNAKASLGNAILAGTSTFAMAGGGSPTAATYTNIQYFRFFPNYAFQFTQNNTFTPGATTQYLLVVNPSNDPIAPGGISMYSYTTGNNGNTITIVNRLGPTNAGAQVSTLGAVTWNAGVWNGLHTTYNPAGATILLCNQYGTPLGDTVLIGANAVVRGYGSMRNTRSQWVVDGGFETRKYITSVFGQALRTNVNGVAPGYVRLRHAISYPQLGIPTIV